MKSQHSKNIRSIIVLITMIVSFLSVIGVVIVAQVLGFSPGDFHAPEKTLEPATLLAVLAILLVPVLIVIGVQKYVLKSDLSVLGLRGAFGKPFAQGTLIGFSLKAIATLAAFAITPGAQASFPAFGGSLFGWLPYFAWFIFTLFLNSFNEEIAYRSFPLSNLSMDSARKNLIVVCMTAFVFSVVHFILEPPLFDKFLYRFCFGLLAGLLYIRSRSLWLIVGLHTGWNLVALSVSDGDWRSGVLLNVGDLNGSIYMNCVVLTAASAFVVWRQCPWQKESSVIKTVRAS